MQFVEYYANNQDMSREAIAMGAVKVAGRIKKADVKTIGVKVFYEYNGPNDKGPSIVVQRGETVEEVVKRLQDDYLNKAHTSEFTVIDVPDSDPEG